MFKYLRTIVSPDPFVIIKRSAGGIKLFIPLGNKSFINIFYFDHRKNIQVMSFYKREMFLSSKVSHANILQYSDRDRKGLIEYTLIPCCRLNRQVTLAVYFFYPFHRFPVEHVQTPGWQATFEAWKPFIVGVLFCQHFTDSFLCSWGKEAITFPQNSTCLIRTPVYTDKGQLFLAQSTDSHQKNQPR